MDPPLESRPEPVNDRQRKITSEAKKQPYSQAAPWIKVPRVPVVSVEHPFIIKNIDKGIETLGGNKSISKAGPSSL